MPDINTIYVSPQEMEKCFSDILMKYGFNENKANQCASIFTKNSVDGVYTHGVYRFPRFVQYIRDGFVKVDAEPALLSKFGGIEQWDGNLGPGILNAMHATKSAVRLAKENGIGCVTLRNTNHWMRGGTYGWQAVQEGIVFIAWTNTIGIMPAWGAIDGKLGNNPLVMAIPNHEEAIVLDMAMSQFSYGSMEKAVMNKEQLTVPGGFDKSGMLTKDPGAILESKRPVPIGYWKGAGLALLLDILAAILSGGLPTQEISKKEAEYGLSQVFIGIDISKLSNYKMIASVVENILSDYHASMAIDGGSGILYPGERVLKTRQKNQVDGIPVLKKLWDDILSL
ncbi:MAG: 3-dehydro-L-gulonate 2-dehydrogenase [Ginsengibacter sp.]